MDNQPDKKRTSQIIRTCMIMVALLIYFWPLSFKNIDIQGELYAAHTIFSVKNGHIDHQYDSYKNITEQQKAEMISIFQGYPYHRKWNTFFSDGVMDNIGSELICLSSYHNDVFSEVMITSRGAIGIDDREYYMRNAKECIEEILKVLLKSQKQTHA